MAFEREFGFNPEVPEQPDMGDQNRYIESEMTELEERALKVVMADIETGKRTNEADRHRRDEAYKLYRDLGDADNERPGRSKVKSSDVMDMIEWLMPNMMRAFFGTKNCISVSPIGNEDVPKAAMLEKLLNWQFIDKGNGFAVGHEWIQASLIYGLCAAKVTWKDVYVNKGFAFPELLEPQFEALRNDYNVEHLTAENVQVQFNPQAMPIVMAAQQHGQPLDNAVEQPSNQQQVYQPEQDPQAAMANNTPPVSPFQQLTAIVGTQMPNEQAMMLQPFMLEPYRVYENVRGEQRIKVYSGPMVEPIPPEDFLYDEEARDMSEARFAIHRVKRTASYLRKKEKEGVYNHIEEAIGRANASRYKVHTDEEDGETTMRAHYREDDAYFVNTKDEQPARRKYSVYEWWGLLDVDDSGIAEPYLVVVCNNTVIRMERNPYAHGEPPFEVMRPILDVFTMQGISIVDLVGEYQKTKTALIRQTLDNISWQNNQMWLVNEASGVDIDSLVNPRPGGIVLTNDLNAVKQIAPAALDNNALAMIEFMQGQLEQRTGVTRYNQGLDASTLNKTATGINAIMNASSQRIELIARVMAETGFRRLYKKMLELDQQFIDQKIVIRVYGKPLEISPDDLAGNFDVTVDIGGATNKDQQTVQQMMTLMNFVPTLMQVGVMKSNNIYQIIKKILTVWGFSDVGSYISDPSETATLQQIVSSIDQFTQAIQQGQQIDPRAVIESISKARSALAMIIGQNTQREKGGNKQVNPQKDANSDAARQGNFLSYASGTSQGGMGNGAKQ